MLLVRWYDHTKWLLERVDSFPTNQRFIFGTRLADTTLDIMELLIEASYTRHKANLLHRANVKLEQLRWLTRLAKDRKLITPRQYEYSAEQLTGVFLLHHPRAQGARGGRRAFSRPHRAPRPRARAGADL